MEYSAPASPEDFERLCIDAGVGGMEAQNALGIALIFRQGCEADFVEAVRWCRAAALQEHPQAQHHLAYDYSVTWWPMSRHSGRKRDER